MGCNGSSDEGVSVLSATREVDVVQVSGVRRNVSGCSFNRQRHVAFRVRNQLNPDVGAGLKPALSALNGVLVDLSQHTK